MKNTDLRTADRGKCHWPVIFLLLVFPGFLVQGCIPPPPREHPKPPVPPGAPHSGAFIPHGSLAAGAGMLQAREVLSDMSRSYAEPSRHNFNNFRV